jgi:uridine kinase
METVSSLKGTGMSGTKSAVGRQTDDEVKSLAVSTTDSNHHENENITSESLEKYDWDELSAKFAEAMEEHCQAEGLVQKETKQLLEVYFTRRRFCPSLDTSKISLIDIQTSF